MRTYPLPSMLFGIATMFLLAGCPAKEDFQGFDSESTTPTEACDNSADDDGDGAADCDDDDCADDPACAAVETETICDDATDNDGDGAIDCADDDCAAACATPESDCADGLDDDGDGATDCSDSDCAADSACTSPTTETACADALDDDGDTLVDCADPDCTADAACALPTTETACGDGYDDDGDTLVDCADDDCAADALCAPLVETACADGLDDDGDGRTDCADRDCDADPACYESVCDDGVDGDGDGLVDCDDADCAADVACEVCDDGALYSVLGRSVATGSTGGALDDFTVSCTSSTAEDVAFTWTAPADGSYVFSTDGSDFDTALTLWPDVCPVSGELDCDDDGGIDTQSLLTVTAAAGDSYLVVVDGFSSNSGNYVLNIFEAAESDCTDGADTDGDGFTDCDDSDCATGATCFEGICDDSLDNDGDGAADCDDSDCASEARCIPEPVCDDGVDDDVDGLIDCDDPDCDTAFACAEYCVDTDLGTDVGSAITTGSTVGMGDAHAATCGGTGSADIGWKWTAPADGDYTFDTTGSTFDVVLSLEEDLCTGVELACVDGTGTTAASTLSLTAGDAVLVYLDGASGASGDYTLNVWTSAELDCADGDDEDLDGTVDCDDIDCAGDVVCLPESVCDDAADQDLDGDPDCLDGDCAADAVCDTSTADYDLGSTAGMPAATGTTVGAGDDHLPSCSTSSTAEDLLYAFVAPSSGVWTFDLSGSAYDTVMEVLDTSGVSLGCDDDSGSGTASMLSVPLDAGQLVFVSVDGYSTNAGDFVLAIY